MRIAIREYSDEHVEAVRQFNDRLRRGGQTASFSESCMPHGFVKAPGRTLYEEHFVALEDSTVRGAYGFKHQDFWIGGKAVSIADFWLPISEGTINKSYALVAVALLRDALRRQPLLYGLGMGGYNQPLVRLLKTAGWTMFSVPFFFRVVHPRRFLQNLTCLRRRPAMRWTLDALAVSGLGRLGIQTVQALHRHRVQPDQSIVVEVVDEFSSWVDELWEECKDQYGFSAVRTCDIMQILYPRSEPRFIRLKFTQRSRPIGLAVLLDSRFSNHRHFGDMRLGTIVSCFAAASNAARIVDAARLFLESRGVDLIVSNHSHAMWRRAFREAGFLRGPSNFIFAASPQLTNLLKGANVRQADIHLNRGDGDGPINL